MALNEVKTKLRGITALLFFISGIVAGTWSSRIPEMQQKFQLNDAKWGAVLFSLPAGLILGLPVSSWLIAKFTAYRTSSVSGIIYPLTLCLLPFAPNIYVLVLTLFIFGMSRNFLNISVNTKAVEIQRFFKFPIMAGFHGIWSMACLVAAGIGTVVIWSGITPKYHFLLIAFLSIIIVAIFRVKRSGEIAAERRPFLVKPDRYLLLLGLASLCTMLCEGTMFDWAVNYFDRVVKAGKGFSTSGYSFFIVSMMMGRFVGDKLIAYFGAVKMLIINGMFMAAGFAISVIFPFVWTACFGFLLIGFGDSILVPVIFSLAGKSTKMSPGYAIASVTLIGYTGFVISPLLVGFVSNAFGMQSSFSLMIVISSCISLIAFFIGKRYNMFRN